MSQASRAAAAAAPTGLTARTIVGAARPPRGYFGIGAEGISKSANVGALLRTAHAFGAAFCFTLGAGFDNHAGRAADTADTPEHVPLWRFPDLGAMALPQGCELVGVELHEEATDLPSFRHPLRAAYVLGPERSSLSPALLARCRHLVRIPTRFSLNLAVAGALVLYDRLLQHGRYAERAVSASGPPGPLSERTGHGAPVFRRTRPGWAEAGASAAGGIAPAADHQAADHQGDETEGSEDLPL